MNALYACSFYDELFRFICSTQLPKSVFQWFSERLSSHFEETFLVDFIASDDPAVGRYVVQGTPSFCLSIFRLIAAPTRRFGFAACSGVLVFDGSLQTQDLFTLDGSVSCPRGCFGTR